MQQGKKVDLETLAAVIASTVKGVKPAKPALRLVEPARPRIFDDITRDACLKRIRFLRRAYGLGFMVDQSTFNQLGPESLDDTALSALLKDMEHARELMAEGIDLNDAGLVVVASTPEQFSAHIRSEIQKLGKTIREANITVK